MAALNAARFKLDHEARLYDILAQLANLSFFVGSGLEYPVTLTFTQLLPVCSHL
jgi:hypothetical protein